MRNKVAKRLNATAVALNLRSKKLKRRWRDEHNPKDLDSWLAAIQYNVAKTREELKAKKDAAKVSS